MMSNGGQKRTRSERVAALELPPGQLARVWVGLRTRGAVVRIGMTCLAAVLLCTLMSGWNPPFAYRSGFTPPEDIVATVSFSKPDPVATLNAKELAQSRVRNVYKLNSEPLVKLRALLQTKVEEVLAAKSLADLVDARVWHDFQPGDAAEGMEPTREEQTETFRRFHEALEGPEKLPQFEKALAAALAPFEQRGLLNKLGREHGQGNYEEIAVYTEGKPEVRQTVKLSDVLIGDGNAIHQSLLEHLPSAELADHLFAWLKPRLSRTLTLDEAETKRALEEAANNVMPALAQCEAGEVLVPHGQTIERRQHLQTLRLEYDALMAQRTTAERAARSVAVVAEIFAMLLLCGMYIRYRQYRIISDLRQFTLLLSAGVATVALSYWTATTFDWRAEIIFVLLFGMATAIAYCQELAIVTTGVLAVVVALGTGEGLSQVLVYGGVSITAILQVGHIRSRAKLIYVGLTAGSVAVLLSVVMSVLAAQPLSKPMFRDAFWLALWTLAAGFLMTGLLPFVERAFGVLTDLSLLELGDVAHPLLQEMVRRAPATYNHSVTVGSIAEAAAESIGARGLLVRVGAYFHDIGKMLKTGYFVENQGKEGNLHQSLDGSDLGRQRHLPKPIIDLIQQHHGTTLVEFFYGRAQEQKDSDPNRGEVQEAAFRYPGPKPQTKEAGVLMLADVVESACRALVDPTPARIEGLVRELAERRLRDGQFDESGLTLRELRNIERSLVMSLTALYHSRIKYPDQKSA